MKRNSGLSLGVAGLLGLLIFTTRCSSQSDPGTTGTGGAIGSGGATGQGGSSPGTGGGTAGATGTGGAATGTGGTGSGGSTTGTGGKVTGTGGMTGAGGAGTGGAMLNINDIIPGFDGFYWEATPSGNTALSGTNYPFGPAAGGCPQGATWATTGYLNNKTMAVKGTTGQQYTVNFNVRGVVGTRCYTGGTPGGMPLPAATPNPSGPNSTWYVGGTQFNDSIWNTMEIHVAPAVPNAANVYYANYFPNTSNWCQKEASYETRFSASFPVIGGGNLTFTIHDSNCRTLANCGQVENQATCDTSAARIIDTSGVNPAPTNFTQPRTVSLGGTTYYVQWVWFDVTSVTSP
jgi:hypothetical protein